ncbi:unnamed protein product [Cylindrotheca closterium]|uniref:Uncharacterized protein n=1 Tax=Cylindrotheca closterium TaxID=2856 RepID=A0AAD2CHT4_9STRA|nr:unnamed protein product [Cylindrotheca closterium]
MLKPIPSLVLITSIICISISRAWALTAPSSQENSRNGIQCNDLKPNSKDSSHSGDRRSFLSQVSLTTSAIATATIAPSQANAVITEDSNWPLWTALPVAPFNRRRTIRYEVGPGVYAFDQLIGIYYVHVPIRMSVMAVHQKDPSKRGLVVYAPIAPTKECLSLLQELIDQYGPISDIIDPSTAVEHKVNAGPFARAFPTANFYVTDKQYAFPLNLPDSFLGLPSWTKPLPRTSRGTDMWGGELEHEVLTVKPGIGSMYQDVAIYHKPSESVMICDALFAVTKEPPKILTDEEEYTRALLFHARDTKDEVVEDTPENRRKGWRRIVLLFDFFFPGSGRGDLGPGPILEALKTPLYKDGWGGWKPFSWGEDEIKDFETFSANGKPTILPIIQIILARGPEEVQRWLGVVTKWNFKRVVPMHLDAPLAIGPSEFASTFDFTKTAKNEVRFCDEDVQFLRKAEEGPLNFSVYKSPLGTLRGTPCDLRKPAKS